MLTLRIDSNSRHNTDPVVQFALANIGDAETIEFRIEYTGHEAEPDIITVNRAGEVVEARSSDA